MEVMGFSSCDTQPGFDTATMCWHVGFAVLEEKFFTTSFFGSHSVI
jgi:hypothetical protein